MTPSHADDAPGRAAYAASGFATSVQMNLVIAMSAAVELPARLTALEKLFVAWPSLCREMASLSEVAPKSAAAGRRVAADLRDFVEARVAAPDATDAALMARRQGLGG